MFYSREEYLEDMRRVARELWEKRVRLGEADAPLSLSALEYDAHGDMCASAIMKKFGGWNVAVVEAGLLPNERPIKRVERKNLCKKVGTGAEARWVIPKREPIGERIRYLVFRRDGFKCVFCGAAPRKGNRVILHVDHILPVSKGGTNSIDNLRTLCSKCNRGRGADN
jgi:hypothetical protein